MLCRVRRLLLLALDLGDALFDDDQPLFECLQAADLDLDASRQPWNAIKSLVSMAVDRSSVYCMRWVRSSAVALCISSKRPSM